MPLLAQLTVTALWVPLAVTPPAATFSQLRVTAPEAAPAAAPPPAAVEPSPMAPAAVAPAPSSSTVAAAPGTTVVVPQGTETTIVTPAPIESVSTTTTTPAGTTTTTVTTAPSPAPTLSPKAAVKTLLRYDPYLAPRYRSGRNMMIGGGVMLGVGTLALLSTLSWAVRSREDLDDASSSEERRRLAADRNRSIPTAQVVGGVAAAVAVTGVVLLAVGAVRKRRAIEEARGRVFMQAGPGGMRVRF